MIRFAIVFVVLAGALPGAAHDLAGTAIATDGDTIRLDGRRVRLCGIQAPELGISAGGRAKAAMSALVNGRAVRCVPVGQGTPCDGRSHAASHDRSVAQCFVGDRDIATEMVRAGHARDWRRYSGGHYAR